MKAIKWLVLEKKKKKEIFLLFMSASLRPSLGTSTVRTIALDPFLSALWTSWADTSQLLYTYAQMNIRLECDLLTMWSPKRRQNSNQKDKIFEWTFKRQRRMNTYNWKNWTALQLEATSSIVQEDMEDKTWNKNNLQFMHLSKKISSLFVKSIPL